MGFYQKPFSCRTNYINQTFSICALGVQSASVSIKIWCMKKMFTNARLKSMSRVNVDWPCPDCPGFAEKLEGEADEGCQRWEANPKTHLIIDNQFGLCRKIMNRPMGPYGFNSERKVSKSLTQTRSPHTGYKHRSAWDQPTAPLYNSL